MPLELEPIPLKPYPAHLVLEPMPLELYPIPLEPDPAHLVLETMPLELELTSQVLEPIPQDLEAAPLELKAKHLHLYLDTGYRDVRRNPGAEQRTEGARHHKPGV